ncbi:Phospholipid:diacylglycerol acyltransferase [Fusarium oxysporum f. sp. albedinis]|nr:Phospholipid:diacylglycerol acyltransferase [Fusarium oxysporum f. sp. albedinis]
MHCPEFNCRFSITSTKLWLGAKVSSDPTYLSFANSTLNLPKSCPSLRIEILSFLVFLDPNHLLPFGQNCLLLDLWFAIFFSDTLHYGLSGV